MAKKLTDRVEAWRGRASIRYTMFLSFTASAIIAVFLTGITLYLRFSSQLNTAIQAENQMVMEQVEQSLSTYLRDMLGLADSCSYNVVKGRNVQNEDLTGELMLLYDTYSEYVDSIAVFDPQGNLVATAPAGLLSKDATPQEEPWFSCAVEKPENLHFSQPQVQHVFSNGGSYRWVVPLSSAVELTRGKSTQTGVLLIQLRYSALTELFSHVSLGSNGYVYLTDSDGCLLYHPFLQRMDGKQETAYRVLAEKGDGAYEEVIEGRRCAVLVRTAGYTGWRILGVVSQTGITFDSAREILLVLVIFSAFFLLLTVANFFLSRQLTDPIRQLEVSVRQVEGDGEALIYVGGALETRQLGESVQKMVWQMQCLAQEAAAETAETAENYHVILGRVASGDKFIGTKEGKEHIKRYVQGDCAEMEGAAIAHACWLNRIPFVIIRAISDSADEQANMSYEQFVLLAAKRSSELVEKILEKLA